MIYFIVNRLSGKGKGAVVAERIVLYLREKKVAYQMVTTEYKAHAVKLAARLCAEKDCTALVAVGGDGTFSEVLNGMDLRIPLGLIPSGTGNDFIRSVSGGKTLEEQLDAVIQNRIRPVDFIQVNGRRSINIAGTGFDVDILLRQARLRRYFSGSFSYFAALFITVFTMNFRRFQVEIDGEERMDTPGLLLCAANGKYFGGGLPISLASEINDGMMELVLVKKMPRIMIPYMLVQFLRGKLLKIKKYVEFRRCRSIACSVEPRVDIQLDGELFDMPRFTCTLCAGGLKFLL